MKTDSRRRNLAAALVFSQNKDYNSINDIMKQRSLVMGIYLNPDNGRYQMMLNTDTFVDKSVLIKYTNDLFATEKRFICVSRPRRFGKSVNLNMLSAY